MNHFAKREKRQKMERREEGHTLLLGSGTSVVLISLKWIPMCTNAKNETNRTKENWERRLDSQIRLWPRRNLNALLRLGSILDPKTHKNGSKMEPLFFSLTGNFCELDYIHFMMPPTFPLLALTPHYSGIAIQEEQCPSSFPNWAIRLFAKKTIQSLTSYQRTVPFWIQNRAKMDPKWNQSFFSWTGNFAELNCIHFMMPLSFALLADGETSFGSPFREYAVSCQLLPNNLKVRGKSDSVTKKLQENGSILDPKCAKPDPKWNH